VIDSLCDQFTGQDVAVECFYFDFAVQKEQSSVSTATFAKFSYPSLYLKNNTYLQQQDNKKPSDNYFSDIPLGAL